MEIIFNSWKLKGNPGGLASLDISYTGFRESVHTGLQIVSGSSFFSCMFEDSPRSMSRVLCLESCILPLCQRVVARSSSSATSWVTDIRVLGGQGEDASAQTQQWLLKQVGPESFPPPFILGTATGHAPCPFGQAPYSLHMQHAPGTDSCL